MNPADKAWYDRLGINPGTPPRLYVVPTGPDVAASDEELEHLANVEALTQGTFEPAMLTL